MAQRLQQWGSAALAAAPQPLSPMDVADVDPAPTGNKKPLRESEVQEEVLGQGDLFLFSTVQLQVMIRKAAEVAVRLELKGTGPTAVPIAGGDASGGGGDIGNAPESVSRRLRGRAA